MFKFKNIFSVRGLLIFALIAVNILVVGCQKMVVEGKSALISNEGVRAEALLPDDSWVVLKIGTDDDVQLKNLNELMSYFPEDGFEFLQKELAGDFNKDFESIGISYEKDFQSAIGDSLQMLFAFGGDMQNDPEPKMLMIIAPKDAKKIEEFMNLSVDKGEMEMEKYDSFTIFMGKETDMYFVRYKDVLLAGNNIDYVKESLNRVGSGESSLLTNKHYQQGVAEMDGSLGFVFMDIGFVMDQVVSDSDAMKSLKGMEGIMNFASAVKGEFFSIAAKEEGFEIVGIVYMDSEKISKFGLDEIYNTMVPSYLYKQLPGDGIIFYSENQNLRASIDILLNVYDEIDEFEDAVTMIKAGLLSNGINFEDDLLVFMDKGYAFGLYSDDGLIPSFGIFIDASSNVVGANKVIKIMNEKLTVFLEKTKKEVNGTWEHGERDCKEGECYAMMFDFDSIPNEQKNDMPEELLADSIEFGYGVTDYDLAYLAIYPEFSNGGFNTLNKNKNFNESIKLIEGFNYQIIYFDVEAGVDLLDRWVQFGLKMDEGANAGMEDYEMVKRYVKPVKSLVLGSKKAEGDKMEVRGFIKISN